MPASHRDILRSVFDTIKESGGFPCHDRHPTAHALTKDALAPDGKFHTLDCAGYKLWGLDAEEKLKKEKRT